MVTINETRVVEGTVDRVWEIVSDVDRDPEYWNGLNSVRNLRREGNVVERVVEVGFIGSRSTQRVELKPKVSVVVIMTEGPLKGAREIRLAPLEGGGRTRVEASWDFAFSEVPSFARPFVKSQLERGTKEALLRIAAEVEQYSRNLTKPAYAARKRAK